MVIFSCWTTFQWSLLFICTLLLFSIRPLTTVKDIDRSRFYSPWGPRSSFLPLDKSMIPTFLSDFHWILIQKQGLSMGWNCGRENYRRKNLKLTGRNSNRGRPGRRADAKTIRPRRPLFLLYYLNNARSQKRNTFKSTSSARCGTWKGVKPVLCNNLSQWRTIVCSWN